MVCPEKLFIIHDICPLHPLERTIQILIIKLDPVKCRTRCYLFAVPVKVDMESILCQAFHHPVTGAHSMYCIPIVKNQLKPERIFTIILIITVIVK